MILSYIRKSKKAISGLFIVLLLSNTLAATNALALTSGPSQPEVQAFEPASTTDMVDLFTGDFTYNIPLFELPGPNGGYPFNLAYHAGITTDQEASWVGLGWSLNPGAITRQMRGLPDEFDGDKVTSTKTMKPNKTAGIGAGVGGELFGGNKLQGSVGLSVFHNNYRGVGYSIDGQLGFPFASRGPMTADLGLGFSLSPQEGMRLSPSLGLAVHDKVNNRTIRADVGVGYHSTHGLTDMSYGMSMSKQIDITYFNKDGKKTKMKDHFSAGFSSRLSMFNPGYTPQITMPTIGANLSLKFSGGAAWWAAYGKIYVSGFYNSEKLKYNGEAREIPAYGYMNYQKADEKSMLDFNREKDGIIRKEIPNLPLPIATNDIYSVTGQGVSGMYRPIRNDIGTLYDPVSESVSNTVSAGIDAAPAASHVGVNLGLFHSKSESGKWSFNNAPYFEGEEENEASEPWYFKVHGEHSSIPFSDYSKLGGVEPVAINLSNTESATLNLSSANKERKPRAQTIQSFTNKQIRDGNSSVLPLLKIELDRSDKLKYPDHHIAGFITTKDDGMRYVYALPAYNRSQEEMVYQVPKEANWEADITEATYSVDKEKFSSRTELPAYTHSHLLTGVVGPDYVDVTNNGISQDDLGYWVKFSYEPTTNGSLYEWRTPYSGANYNAGYESDNDDDRGSFLSGTKEVWYLAQAETKTHIAKFHIADRLDNRSTGAENNKSKRLEKIELIAKASDPENDEFISSVHFLHDYSLCPGTPNSTASNHGKLTLNRLFFKYGKSTRELGAYDFDYQNKDFAYSNKAHDRWGYYKNPDTGWKKDFPYVEQISAPSEVAAWSLNKIDLPSGGSIEIDYESDDYAYVQHKRAMQMMPITNENLKTSGGKIEFKLEKAYEGESSQEEAFIREEYLDFEVDQLYFKARVHLTGTASDIVSGYMTVDFSKLIGVTEDGQRGFFHVKSKESDYHPISQMAWQHMRVNQPQLVNTLGLPDPNQSINFFKQLAGAIGGIRDLFSEFNTKAANRGWASSLDTDHSWIRLTSPDKIKYGGGLRVKRILIREGINSERKDVYGHVYNYKIEEGGRKISSGVAAYEPIIGGEENPLRTAKNYTQAIKLQSDNNLYFEYPINESHYPGPHVGYRKVTVMSLASAAKIKDDQGNYAYDPEDNFPDDVSYGSSGKSEYEFYTAYDFPVIGKETPIQKKNRKEISLNPLLGVNSSQSLTATQGYSIMTNDMHGKPKKISQFGQSASTGEFVSEPYAYTSYEYQHKKISYDKQLVQVLNNEFKKDGKNPFLVQRIKKDENVSSENKFLMGTEYEMVTDGRLFNSASFEGGVSVNVDIAYAIFPIVIPTGWPNISEDKSELKTAVTNKVIFNSGILTETTTFQDGAEVVTAYTKWDKLTGRPMLTEVTEKFANKKVYTYQVPGYSTYEGLGPAYQNTGLVFGATAVVPVEGKANEYEMHVQNRVANQLYAGDEFIFHQLDDDREITGKGTAIYLGTASGQHRFYSNTSFSGRLTGIVARSGRRNILTADVSGFSALQDPSKNSGLGVEEYEGQLIVPNNE